MKDLLEKALNANIISFIGIDRSQVCYRQFGRTVSYLEEKERIRLKNYLELLFKYNYPKEQIEIDFSSFNKLEDIILYVDTAKKSPLAIIICCSPQISESEFQQVVTNSCYRAKEYRAKELFVVVTNGLKTECWYSSKYRKFQVPDIPKYGQKQIPHYRYVKGGGKNGIEGYDISVIDNASLTSIFKQAHNSLWSGGQLNPSEAFDELDKLIFCKIWDERKERRDGEPYDFQIINDDIFQYEDESSRRLEENLSLFNRVKNLYEEGRKKDPAVFRDSIRLSPEKVRTVVSYLEGINLSATDLDSKGHAFETFMDSFFRGNFGQYFTPRNVVSFIVDVLPITNKSKVIDTSCGSGGFLLYALDKVRKQASSLYPTFTTDTTQKEKWYNCWHDFASNNLFGIEISEQISRAAKMNMIIHDDGHTNVVTADGLVADSVLQEEYGNSGFKYGTFDFVITNPPFGSRISAFEKSYLKKYVLGCKYYDWLDGTNCSKFKEISKVRDAQSSEVLFIEQDYMFLKEGGVLAMVIPDGILSNSSLLYVRDKIATWFQILAVISLPQYTFASNGAGVKSSVLFLKKREKKEVAMIEDTIVSVKEKILAEYNYADSYKHSLKEKKQEIKRRIDELSDDATKEEINQVKAEVNLCYNAKLARLKEEMLGVYQERLIHSIKNYDVFMALIDNVGYDSTGRPSSQNELKDIEAQLADFIEKNIK